MLFCKNNGQITHNAKIFSLQKIIFLKIITKEIDNTYLKTDLEK